jgi:hypothetical protein
VRNRKLVASLVPSLWAAAALLLTLSPIAEIAAVPTATEGVASSTWTPITAVTALFFGQDAMHGSFNLPSILFGLGVILLVSFLAGSLATAFITYCLGWQPPPAAAGLLGAALGLAAEILLINLLCNWLQSDNAIYNSLPNWGWWVGWGAWGSALGVSLSRVGSGGGVAGPSPLLSADPYPRPRP